MLFYGFKRIQGTALFWPFSDLWYISTCIPVHYIYEKINISFVHCVFNCHEYIVEEEIGKWQFINQSDWNQLLCYIHYPSPLLISDIAQLEVISRWTFIYEYLFTKPTNHRSLHLWCSNKKARKALFRFFIGLSWVHLDMTSDRVLLDVWGSVAYYNSWF